MIVTRMGRVDVYRSTLRATIGKRGGALPRERLYVGYSAAHRSRNSALCFIPRRGVKFRTPLTSNAPSVWAGSYIPG